MKNSLRIVFAGTPDFAARHLMALLSSHHQVIAVYTKPDKPAGRGKKVTISPVKALSLEHNIAVYQPDNFKSEQEVQTLAQLNCDIMVVVAYGLLLPKTLLETPRLGCINVHGSILPRWRGAAPIQRSIWAGDNETGVTIMQMDEGLDTGDMLKIAKLSIDENETSASLYQRLAELAPSALIECLDDIAASKAIAIKQDNEQANYAKKLSKEEACIDWNMSAQAIERCIRAFNPWPMSYFNLKINNQDHNIKVWQAVAQQQTHDAAPSTILSADKNGICVATADGILRLMTLQPPGKKAMNAFDLMNSRQDWFKVGKKLIN